MEQKTCCRCEKERDVTDFTFKNKSKNIRNITCKFCFVDIRKNWYIKNKANVINKNIVNKNKNIEWFNDYKKTLVCSKCGETHPACLDFHHLDTTKKDWSVSIIARSTYSRETIMKEIKKCIILCSNCHRKLHYNENNALIA